MWPGCAHDVRVAFVAVPDGPNIVTGLDNFDTLVTPGSLKASSLHGDDGLSVGVIVVELPLQVTVIINTNYEIIDTS